MAVNYVCRFMRILFLSYLTQAAVAVMVDNTDPSLVYSNSGPSWWLANGYNGAGRYVSLRTSSSDTSYGMTAHQAVGDGASVTFTFTGTRVSLISTICNNTAYNTTVDFYIDGQFRERYNHIVPGPMEIATPTSPYITDIDVQVTIAEFTGLSKARHTLRAVSVGAVLFVVDAFDFDPSDASEEISTSSSRSTVPTSSGSTGSSTTRSSTSTSSSSSSSSSSTQATTSTLGGNFQGVIASMDVSASDIRIAYSPPEAWKQYSDSRRAPSCLEGTMSSSTPGSSLTYNFTGSTIQLYTISGPNGGNYTVSIDGVNQGAYSSYDASADPSNCPSIPLYSTTSLTNTPHLLVLTVQDHPSGSTQDTIQFVGFRMQPSSIDTSPSGSSTSPSTNIGAIVGGVVGGVAGVVVLVLLIVWWMRRQRRALEEDAARIPDTSNSSGADPFFSEGLGESNSHSQQSHWVDGSSASMIAPLRRVAYDDYAATPPPVNHQQYQQQPGYYDYAMPPPSQMDAMTPSQGDDDGASTQLDRLTFYTLPSYHENVRSRPAARDLSEADVNAISRRLVEVMQSQVVQRGGDPNQLGGVIPPRELIDHLVEEQRQPRDL